LRLVASLKHSPSGSYFFAVPTLLRLETHPHEIAAGGFVVELRAVGDVAAVCGEIAGDRRGNAPDRRAGDAQCEAVVFRGHGVTPSRLTGRSALPVCEKIGRELFAANEAGPFAAGQQA